MQNPRRLTEKERNRPLVVTPEQALVLEAIDRRIADRPDVVSLKPHEADLFMNRLIHGGKAVVR